MISKERVERQRRSFETYNVRRIYTASSLFSEKEQTIFGIVPMLLQHHVGEIGDFSTSSPAPFGIHGFTTQPFHLEVFRKVFPGIDIPPPPAMASIQSVVLVGSLGTMAQTRKSDFDYVLFYDDGAMSDRQLIALHDKLLKIEEWAMRVFGVEVHFFLKDMEDFARNRFGKTDSENVGTALGKLFKDEFYRTAIFVAGKRPLWWVTPPGLPEDGYAAFREEFRAAYGDEGEGYMDLGHLQKVDPAEYFGAALWQINKSFNSPFKSLLKMGLLESYLFTPESDLLCEDIKGVVINSNPSEEVSDPYVMMCKRVLDYYDSRGMHGEAALLRKAFLVKAGVTGEFVSRVFSMPQTALDARSRIIKEILLAWGWQEKEGMVLDEYLTCAEGRQYNTVGEVGRFFLNVYKRLSDWLREKSVISPMISEKDMTVLGRKIFSVFDMWPGKIPYVYPGSRPATRSSHLVLVSRREEGGVSWLLYDYQYLGGSLYSLQKNATYFWKWPSLVELLAWMVINGIWVPGVVLHFNGGGSAYNSNDVKGLLQAVYVFFAKNAIPSPQRDDYLAARRIVKVFVVPNLGLYQAPGQIERVDLIFYDSWGEYSHVRKGIKEALEKVVEVFKDAEREGKALQMEVYPPPTQADPRLADEFEHMLLQRMAADKGKYMKNGKISYKKKSRLDLG